MDLVGFPCKALSLPGARGMREESRKRVQRVLAFFKHEEATQCLRRTALCFQLTGGVEALVTESKKPNEPPSRCAWLRARRGTSSAIARRASLEPCLWIHRWDWQPQQAPF